MIVRQNYAKLFHGRLPLKSPTEDHLNFRPLSSSRFADKGSSCQIHALPHAQQSKACPGGCAGSGCGYIKAQPIVANSQLQFISPAMQLDFHLCRPRMAQDIGESFLRNAKTSDLNGGVATLELFIHVKADSKCAPRRVNLDVRAQRGGQAHFIQ